MSLRPFMRHHKAMRTLPALLSCAAFLLFAADARAGAGGPCGLLTEPKVRELTGIDGGHFTAQPQGSTTCSYTFPGLPATSDKFGNSLSAPSLTIEKRHLPTDAAAHQLMLERGRITTSTLLTEDPLHDEVGDLEKPLGDPEEHEYLVIGGGSARHGSTVVLIGLSDGTDEPPQGELLLQNTMLTLAGAQMAAAVHTDLCVKFPVHTLQTLISLGPSTGQITGHSYADNTNRCNWQILSDAGKSPATIELSVQQFLTPALALEQLNQDVPSRQDVTPIPHVSDPADKAFSHRGHDASAEAVHGVFLARLAIDGAEPDATAVPSYAGRLERLALEAAGADLPPDSAIPPATEAPPRTAKTRFHNLLSGLPGLWLIALVILAFLAFAWLRRRSVRV